VSGNVSKSSKFRLMKTIVVPFEEEQEQVHTKGDIGFREVSLRRECRKKSVLAEEGRVIYHIQPKYSDADIMPASKAFDPEKPKPSPLPQF
jgi:hypothetical protein